MLSTLRRYVEALGGELEVRAVFNGGQTVKLTGCDRSRLAAGPDSAGVTAEYER